MADDRSPFEQTVALTAAARDTTPDVARAGVVNESLQWILDNLPSQTDRDQFAAALTTARERLDERADRHLESIENTVDILASGDFDDDTTELDDEVSQAEGAAHVVRVVAQSIGDTARYTTMNTTGLHTPTPSRHDADTSAEQAAAGPSLGANGTATDRPGPARGAQPQGIPHGRTLPAGATVAFTPKGPTR